MEIIHLDNTSRKRENNNSLHSSTKKNHSLQQYLQNTLSTLLNGDKILSCLFLIKQLESSLPKIAATFLNNIYATSFKSFHEQPIWTEI